jgi:predicted anti-sigma-YlaC factor YlaD
MTAKPADDPRRLVERLLGPAAGEITCEECFELLDAYVELELAGAAADTHVPGMRPHLRGCTACRDDHDSLSALLQTDPPTPSRRSGPPTPRRRWPRRSAPGVRGQRWW